MTSSRLRNKFLKNPSNANKINYTKYRNYCTGLFKKEKKAFYNNIDTKSITDNRTFWKTVQPMFSDKHITNNKITLLEGEEIITDNFEIAETFNASFTNVVDNLDIQEFDISDYSADPDLDITYNIIEKFKNHPSIPKIKENVQVETKFHFDEINEAGIKDNINSFDKKNHHLNNIPTRLLVENNDIISPFSTDICNESISNVDFADSLKLADITPAHKKEERTKKDNYRLASILPSISKIFERNMYDQISLYINKYLSPYLCGFRKGFNTQHCLTGMLERWKKELDNGKIAGALLTDLSKAFDCINHELIIAKLEAYGFDHGSLTYILSYLSDRKQRTKVNTSFSSWSNIKTGVPKGSILGPLLFNIYLNDIFYFVNKSDLTNYADDTTPYAIDTNTDALVQSLENDTLILIKWFRDNYLQLNADRCHLLITNHDNGIPMNVGNEVIECENSVKLLGITIDTKLDFSKHVSTLCRKANQK